MPPLDTTPWTGSDAPYLMVRKETERMDKERLTVFVDRSSQTWRDKPSSPMFLFRYAIARWRLETRYGTKTPPISRRSFEAVPDPHVREYTLLRLLYSITSIHGTSAALFNGGMSESLRAIDKLLVKDPNDLPLLSIGSRCHSVFKVGDGAKGIRLARRLVALDPEGKAYPLGRFRLGFALSFRKFANLPQSVRDDMHREAIDNMTRYLRIAPPWHDYERSVAQATLNGLTKKEGSSFRRGEQ